MTEPAPGTLADVIARLALLARGADVFEAPGIADGPHIFGGQLIGQALAAADATVDPALRAHSIQCQFVRGGDARLPIAYHVERVRDGASVSLRHVAARQHDRLLFSATATFSRGGDGPAHQHARMPDMPPPETLRRQRDLLAAHPSVGARELNLHGAFDVRPLHALDPVAFAPRPPVQYCWLRGDGTAGDDARRHALLIAWASDFYLLYTALLPFGDGLLSDRTMALSFTHSLWFHAAARADDWLLYAMESPVAGNGHALTHGSLFARDGTLVASVMQDGVLRAGPRPSTRH